MSSLGYHGSLPIGGKLYMETSSFMKEEDLGRHRLRKAAAKGKRRAKKWRQEFGELASCCWKRSQTVRVADHKGCSPLGWIEPEG